MGGKKINKRAEEININKDSDKEFLFIHGYTGSPSGFDGLPKKLSDRFNASVRAPRLLGHGTSIKDLDNYSLEDYVFQMENILKEELEKGKKVVLVGFSFGAQLALYFSAKYPVEAVILVAIPYRLSFFLSTRFVVNLFRIKKNWKKPLSEEEVKNREGSFYYDSMPGYFLKIINSLNKKLKPLLPNVRVPIFVANSSFDKWIPHKSIVDLLSKVGSKKQEFFIMKKARHNPFYHSEGKELEKKIVNFIKDHKLFVNKGIVYEGVSAIVPAYNEEVRIGCVLDVLSSSDLIKEIIVVDDGSSDNTSEVVKKFEKVKLIRNKTNMGKAYSMNLGVERSKFDVVFFCDADIRNLDKKAIENIILPILEGDYDMFIGVRNNKMQKTWKLVALNSGERALRKRVWYSLPDFYKHRYRIEYGLNSFVRIFSKKGLGYEVMSYYQTLKEKKYGFWKGTFLRWWMNLDVFSAMLRFNLYDRWKK